MFMCIWIILALLLFIEFTGGDQEGDACLMLMCLSFYSVNLQKQSRIIGGVFLLSSILSYLFCDSVQTEKLVRYVPPVGVKPLTSCMKGKHSIQ